MLTMLAVVLAGSALVLGRLFSGTSVDLSKLNMTILNLQEDPARDTADEADDGSNDRTQGTSRTQMTAPPEETPILQNAGNSFTLTVGGSICLSGEVRKNSKSSDAKIADYADVMMLLAPRISSDINGVFLENILSDSLKQNDNTAPVSATILLQEAGFNMAACGFAQAYAGSKDGVESTLSALDGRGISALGVRYADDNGGPTVRNVNGVKVSFLQYTANVPAKTRKTMQKEGTEGMVPEAELSLIRQEIAAVREKGAEAVIVLISWGKNGKDPDRSQRELAEGIAMAGADLIVGCGSHVPQTTEYLTGLNGKNVLCTWSLGSLLSGDRNGIRKMSGYLLHVTVRADGQGGAEITNASYTPVYTWKYKQDSRFYYRCIAVDSEAPDGMDNEQMKNMARAAETVNEVLQGSPLGERGQTDAD